MMVSVTWRPLGDVITMDEKDGPVCNLVLRTMPDGAPPVRAILDRVLGASALSEIRGFAMSHIGKLPETLIQEPNGTAFVHMLRMVLEAGVSIKMLVARPSTQHPEPGS